MRNQKHSDSNDAISYWESMTDLMSALILIVLLIFALVLLYIVRNPGKENKELFEADAYEEITDDAAGDYDTDSTLPGSSAAYIEVDHNDNGGGGYDEHKYDHEYDYEYPGITDDYGKTAVHVTVIDEQTEKPVRYKGIEFQLFRKRDRAGDLLQVLCSYYPQRVEYNKFSTTADGVFYLPEKIPAGAYYFHGLTPPDGYDAADSDTFLIREARDWNDPYEITILLQPSRNKIRIRMTDKATGAFVDGAVFDVIAAEDIVTHDGTLRYSRGQIVDHIRCGNDGTGESSELYLGSYQLAETAVPEYYAALSDMISVELVRKNEKSEKESVIEAEKTSLTCTVVDEADETQHVSGAQFAVTNTKDASDRRIYTSDGSGRFTITDLSKNTDYIICQTAETDGYRALEENLFTVSDDGHINGAASSALSIVNRRLRLKVSVRDAVFRNLISDRSAALYDNDGQLIRRWDSSGAAQLIEGIAPGTYQLILDGNSGRPYLITAEDTCEVQEFSVSVRTVYDIAAAVVLFVLVCTAVILRVRKSKRNK